MHDYVDADWKLTIQLTAAPRAWQREANRRIPRKSSTHEGRLQLDLKRHNGDGDTLELQQVAFGWSPLTSLKSATSVCSRRI